PAPGRACSPETPFLHSQPLATADVPQVGAPSLQGSFLRAFRQPDPATGSMNHPFIKHLIEQASSIHGRVAIPDAVYDDRVMHAAAEVHKRGWLDVVLVGSRRECQEMAEKVGVDISGVEILDADELPEFADYCAEYGRIRAKENLTEQQIDALMRDPAYLSCMLHRKGV